MKPGYKQTEVGMIPEDWIVSPIGSLGTVIRGASPRPKGDKRYYGGDIPRLMVEDVTRDKKYVIPRIDFLTPEGAKRSRPCKRGTLTIVCSGTPGVVGMPSFLAVDACIHDGMLALVNLSPRVVSDYLFHQLRSYQEKLYMAATHGGTFVNLTTAGLRAFEVVCPQTETEQRVIAEALSDVDELIGTLDALIAKKRDLKQAAMQQLLTAQTRLPGFSGEWTVKRIDELGVWKGGMTPSMQNPSYWNGGDVPWISSGDVKSVLITETKSCITNTAVKKGTTTLLPTNSIILVTRSGILRNYLPVAMTTKPMAINQDIKALLPDKDFHAPFLLHTLIGHGEKILARCLKAGTTVESIELRWLKAFTIPMPLPPEQTAIATVLSDMDAELAALEARREKTRALKQGMMQQLLTGQIRLV